VSTRVPARAWVAGPDEAEAIAGLLVEFRDHMGSGWPSENAFLASVERLLEDRDTEFLLATPDDGRAARGRAAAALPPQRLEGRPDAWIEDLFVRADARRAASATPS